MTAFSHLDEISSRLVTLSPPEAAQKPAQQQQPEPDEGPRTIRADIAEADALLQGVAAAHALLNRLRGTTQGLEQVRQFGGLQRSLGSLIEQMDRELRQLRETAERLRLVAAGSLFTALERTARDTARAQGKRVTFEGRGGDIRLDAHVLEGVQGALIQIIRNAVAHGIEPEAERTTAGKPPAGRVSVHVSRRGRQMVFVCRDDGRGVDLEAVRRVATQRGLLDRNSSDLDARGLLRLLLRGGISTSGTVTDVSGRGLGLDVVRESIERLGGQVEFHTERGAGTTIELVIPPSLASMEALVIEAEGADGALSRTSIPLAAVHSTLRLTARDISRGSPGDVIMFEQKAIPFIPLASALNGRPWSPRRSWTTLIVAGAEGLAAVGVDRLLGTGRVVSLPLPQFVRASPIVVGASLDADGNPQLVLDPGGLVSAALRGRSDRLDTMPTTRTVLVIDDSPTTRMLEQSILESAGYHVDLAVSAEDALDILRHKRYGLILVDAEMPGMDGFTFIERIRSHPALLDIPAILVTSRASPEDRQRGRDAGAQGHIVKSEFDQAQLLAMIRPMMR